MQFQLYCVPRFFSHSQKKQKLFRWVDRTVHPCTSTEMNITVEELWLVKQGGRVALENFLFCSLSLYQYRKWLYATQVRWVVSSRLGAGHSIKIAFSLIPFFKLISYSHKGSVVLLVTCNWAFKPSPSDGWSQQQNIIHLQTKADSI